MIKFLPLRYGCVATLFFALASVAAAAGQASVKVTGAWVRATVPGQPVAGAYLDIESPGPVRLVAVDSAVARRGEIHEMKEVDGMMTMRALPGLAVPGRTVVKLAPGGVHIMLFDLKQPLRAGSEVVLTLTFERAGGVRFKQRVSAPVREPDAADAKH